MFEHASISPVSVLPVRLSALPSKNRYRDIIDKKRNFFILKRFFDIFFSVLFISCVLSWLLPVLCLLVKLTSKGPVLFLQKRIGFGGRSFTCYKLRTMVVNDESDILQASENDTRITRIGWFLRKSNMDEFPQFFNVLKGDMSIVGPRPHMYTDCTRFASLLPAYKFRNMVRPGLTGLAQIKGYHGPATNWERILMRYQWDHYYIHHAGFIMDAGIILRTIAQRILAIVLSFPLLLPFSFKRKREVLPG